MATARIHPSTTQTSVLEPIIVALLGRRIHVTLSMNRIGATTVAQASSQGVRAPVQGQAHLTEMRIHLQIPAVVTAECATISAFGFHTS